MPYDFRQMRARTRGRSGREVSGQYRVTVPDPDVLDRLRMQNRVYDRTLMPRDWFAGSVPVGVHSLPGLSRESSTEPMDMDEGARLWKAYVTRGIGYTPTPKGTYRIPSSIRSLPEAGRKGRRHWPLGERRREVTHRGDRAPQNCRPYYKFHCVWQLVLWKRGIRVFTGQRWWILRTTWTGGRTLEGLALRSDLDLAPRQLLRRPKDFREGRIFTCPW